MRGFTSNPPPLRFALSRQTLHDCPYQLFMQTFLPDRSLSGKVLSGIAMAQVVEVKCSTRFFNIRNAWSNAASISTSDPVAFAGSGVLQCILVGAPRNNGHASAAA